MNIQLPELTGVTVHLDNLIYHQEAHFHANKPHAFIYFITIENSTQEKITLIGRKWIIQNADQTYQVIEGDGVVGKNPTLSPQESFSYNSYHVTDQNCIAYGSYIALDQHSKPFIIPIPRFKMIVPHAAKQSN